MPSETLQLALLVLLAILVGMLIPVLLELRAAAKSARKQIRSTGPRVDGLLDDARATMRRLDPLSRALAGGDREVARLLESLGHTADTLDRLERGMRVGVAVGSAVGPAVSAFVTALREPREGGEPPSPGETDSKGSNGGGAIPSAKAGHAGPQEGDRS